MRPRARFQIAAAALLLACAPTWAEVTIETLVPSLERLRDSGTSAEACEHEYSRAGKLNSPNLLYAAGVCFGAKNDLRGATLLLAGQVRSMVDLGLFEPENESDKMAMANLWGILFYRLGGGGPNNIYQDPVVRDQLFSQLREWLPDASAEYSPGWNFKKRPDSVEYQKSISDAREHRIAQLQAYAKLVSNPDYLEAQTELNAIQSRNPKGIGSDTPDGKRAAELMQKMSTLRIKMKEDTSR
jgi:hypothetical protein